MDFLRFVDSRAVREHWKKIGYTCDARQTAWLISVCDSVTLRERHNAWNELIETMPDCPLEQRMNVVPRDSLHQVLREIMEIDQRNLEDFFRDEEDAVYQYTFSSETVYTWENVFLFSSFETCRKAMEQARSEEPDILAFDVTKRYLDRPKPFFTMHLSKDLQPMGINRWPCRDKQESLTVHCSLEGLWFPFPLPFEKGDLVCQRHHPNDPLVLKWCDLKGVTDWNRKNGGLSDMFLTVYESDEDGRIFHHSVPLWNLEYYEKPLAGTERVLLALQYFYKGKLEAPEFAELYSDIRMEEIAKQSAQWSDDLPELLGKQEAKSAEMKPTSDPFYSENNIRYLENVVRDIKAGKAHFSEHELSEVDE